MTMKFREIRAQADADPGRQERVEQYKRAMETALALAQLRELRDITQREVADRMAVSQANVSRIEHEDDVYLSTLRGYIEALGGRLELRAVFPDQVLEIGEGEVHVLPTVVHS